MMTGAILEALVAMHRCLLRRMASSEAKQFNYVVAYREGPVPVKSWILGLLSGFQG